MNEGVVPGRRGLHSLAALPLLVLLLFAGSVTWRLRQDAYAVAPPEATPMPMVAPGEVPDRLAQPALPESPTQVDTGRYAYYFHCMPCHGDRGQGLTDEWRQVWVEDHQNCWGRGCHTGRELAAFPIPKFIPPVMGSSGALGRFRTADELFTYLRDTQPPQRVGALSEDEYWALTAFLLHENSRMPDNAELGDHARPKPDRDVLLAAILGPMLGILLVSWAGKRRESR